jgi:hypothetical protein
MARKLIAEGGLEPLGPVRNKDMACADCGRNRYKGRALPCDRKEHRCVKVISGYRCKFAVQPGLTLCSHHAEYWATALPRPESAAGEAPVKPKRGRPKGSVNANRKLTDAACTEVAEKCKAGTSTAALAREFHVSTKCIRDALVRASA